MSLCSTSVENLGRQYSVLNAISSNLRDLSSRATTSSKEPSDILLINSQMTFSKAVQQLEYQDEVNPCESGDFFSKLDCSDVSRAIAQVGFIIPRERATGTPRDVACIESSNTSLALQWLPPQPVSFVPLAELPKVIGYTVFVKSGAVATAVQHSTEAPSLHISNLPKGTTHNVCVRAEYSDFHGTCSPEYTFATPSALQFKFISDWDTAGIIYYLGTKYRHQSTFQNPHTLGLVQASWSRTGTGSPENVLSRNWQFGNQTGSSASSWWQIDLRPCGAFVRPTKYSLRHDCNASNFLRLWELRASRDGESWTIIASHLRDRTLCEPHGVGSWDISRNAGGFSIFRVVMTGPCSNGNNKLFLSGFEIYGELEFVLETAKSL
ncbi:HECT-domain protein [Pelomyxa schiedti]|nr:HECT-domain protein [Pelomyxa schiedti]